MRMFWSLTLNDIYQGSLAQHIGTQGDILQACTPVLASDIRNLEVVV